jgi:two-component sensor histidine kinase
MKYAFSSGKGGEINISLFREGAEKKLENEIGYGTYENLTLIFSDNGRGLPDNLDFRNAESLGLQLVNALVDQIDGILDLNRENGTKFTIKFRDLISMDAMKNEQA